MVLHQAIMVFMFTIFIISSTRAQILNPNSNSNSNSTICNRTCGYGKSSTTLNYPFGFSASCPIQLNCSSDNSNNNAIQIGEFKVQNITPNSILINLPSKCNRPIQSIFPLFSQNYKPKWQNSVLLRNCTNNTLKGCVIPASFLQDQFEVESCDSKTDGIRCFPEERNTAGEGFLSYDKVNRTQCSFLFSAIALESDERSSNSGLSLQFGKVRLGWWLEGPCKCHKSANCTEVGLENGNGMLGFRCRCNEGFQGDGFADGDGCNRVSDCYASKYLSGHCGGTTRVGVLVGGIVAGAFLMSGLALCCYFIRRRSTSLRNRMSAKRFLCEAAGNSSIPFYTYKDIERATNVFSEEQRLGTGAYGTVYAGKLHNDEWVAIKKIRHRDTDGIGQVMNEIKLLSSVSHPNLVRLLGFCIEKGEQILVYEFMPNGTLSQHLQRERGKGLPWTIRITIATETAHAIAHLHSAMNPPIFHRDIKSSNILLDYNFKSKVADFGLSREGMTELSHVSTAPQGTPGYLDPQYHQSFHLSDKSDVYSFGVVLIEIITALKVVDFSRPHSEVNLAALAIDRIRRGCIDEIIDPFLEPHRDAWTLSSIHKVAELAFRCLAFHRDMRPTMIEVADELEHVRLSGLAPQDENICMTSSVASSCSSPYGGSEKSFGGVSVKGGVGSRRLVVSQRPADCLATMEEVKDSSPVSVQDPWLSEQSSPSSNSLLGNVIQ